MNYILKSLPTSEHKQLFSHLDTISLQSDDVLSEVGAPYTYGYFPQSGLIATLAIMRDGRSVEIGLMGSEGFAGLPILLNIAPSSRVVVQISGHAMRIKANALHALVPKLPALENLLSRFACLQALRTEQLAACNTFHSVEQRLARWLLTAADRASVEHLSLTQGQLASMLGTRRASVTVAAISLQKAGIVEYERGRLRILNRRQLGKVACECYAIIHGQLEAYLKTGKAIGPEV
jgi:CRP-like cAMP-binding protein